ncbi:phosphoesterase [Flavobacterium sp.]|uniref:phosphoesterase n=1 Tax=Flavobacterium sp. TaxID=239 RepID=UPI0039E45187
MKAIVYCIAILACFCAAAQEAEKKPQHVLYVTGISSRGVDGSAVLQAISSSLGTGEPSSVVITGSGGNEGGNLFSGLAGLKFEPSKIYVLPGPLDWEEGSVIYKKQEAANHIKSVKWLPGNGCGIEKTKLNELADLICVDSRWAMMDWDGLLDFNADCDIRSKDAFYTKLEQEIVKSQGKTVFVAMYHAPVNRGKFGNPYSLGFDPNQVNNNYYENFSDRVMTLSRRFSNVIFVSGGEPDLQYIVKNDIPVVISGIGEPACKPKGGSLVFGSGEEGYAKISLYADGSSFLEMFGSSNHFSKAVFSKEIFPADKALSEVDYHEKENPQYVYKSIYTEEELHHSAAYRLLWGNHFRKDYLTPVKIKTVLLDTLYGGLTPVRKGGGHQTNSLRLTDRNGKEYTLRNSRKDALRFMQYFLFKTFYLTPDMNNTYFIRVLRDSWTTANPYAPLTVPELSDAIGLYHPNPKLFYLPRQKALGIYNEEYAEGVYFIEEQAGSGFGDAPNFGFHDKIIGTEDLLEKLRRRDKNEINESLFIRTRLFDNAIGDFDRHRDQWRWTEDKRDDGTSVYSPVPRDRDQAFCDTDGFVARLLTTFNPMLRFLQRYKSHYQSTRWFNDAGDDVDRLVLVKDTEEDWIREARYIKAHLTPEVVDRAFLNFPEEIDKKRQKQIRDAFLARIDKIETHAGDMYRNLKSFQMITGTDKDDHFVITRLADARTNIKGYRVDKEKGETVFMDVDYDERVTKEIWLYGLDGNDVFEVQGQERAKICIKIVGGKKQDIYRLSNKRKVRIYDQKSDNDVFETGAHKTLNHDYELNQYNYMAGRKVIPSYLPLLAYNPDDGFGIGVSGSLTVNDIRRNPFTSQHKAQASFFTATNGIKVNYKGEFAHVFQNVNLAVSAGYTSPLYTNNFFGFGNETVFDRDRDMDYYRVRLQTIHIAPSLIYRSYGGSSLRFGLRFEDIEVEDTDGRLINSFSFPDRIFKDQRFYSAEASYQYDNFDNASFPRNGLGGGLTVGYTTSFEDNKNFVYLNPELRLTTRLDRRGIVVFATKIKGKHIFNDNYEFYQAAVIGDGDGLRGLRQQRFSGKTALYHNTDIRVSLGRLRTGIIPVKWGFFGGLDYGRVWLEDDYSRKWHITPGGGLFFNLAGFTTANASFFSSEDGGRVSAGLKIEF